MDGCGICKLFKKQNKTEDNSVDIIYTDNLINYTWLSHGESMVLSTVDVHKFFCTLLLFLGSVLYRFVLLPRLTGESIMKGYVTDMVFPFL